MTTRLSLFIFLLMLLWPASGWAQNEAIDVQDEMIFLELKSRMKLFLDDWKEMVSEIQYGSSDNLELMVQRMQQLDAQWMTYSQAQQMDIAADEDLLQMMGLIQTVRQMAEGQLDKKKAEAQMQKNFIEAERFISGKDSIYRRLYKTANQMALVKQAAPRLEKLKAKEQLLFTDIQARYEAAKEAATNIPELQERMKKLEEKYIVMKSASEKIQAAEYKPWITRAKDYLLGFAAVAMLLMFFSFIFTKIKAAKQAKQAAKKMQQMMPNNVKQYPTI